MRKIEPDGVEPIPIHLKPEPSTVTGGMSSISLFVTINQAQPAACTVQIDCGNHGLLNSPSGSWPYQLSVPANTITVTMNIGTNSTTNSTNVQLRGGAAGVDMSNPANWTATALEAVLAPAAPRVACS